MSKRKGHGRPPAISKRGDIASRVAIIGSRTATGERIGVMPPPWQIALLGAVEGMSRALGILRNRDKGSGDTPSETRQRWMDTLQAVGTGLLNTGAFDTHMLADIVALRGALSDLDCGRTHPALAPTNLGRGRAWKVGPYQYHLRGWAAGAADLLATAEGNGAAYSRVAKLLNARDAGHRLGAEGNSVTAQQVQDWRERAMASSAQDHDGYALRLAREWAQSNPDLTVEQVLNEIFGPPITHEPVTAQPIGSGGRA